MKKGEKKVKDREIYISCDFRGAVSGLFNHFSSQLSDGHWENSRPEYGEYGEGYYEDIWNCFNFKCQDKLYSPVKKDCFIIVLKNEPTWPEAAADCKKFHTWSDKEIADYLREALLDSIESYPSAFDFEYTDYELEILTKCIKEWKLLAQPLPVISHKDLVKMVGHDFEYEK